jgi:hypothetical protein
MGEKGEDKAESECRNRYYFDLDPKINRSSGRTGKWTADENNKLKKAIKMNNDKSWRVIAALVPGRSKSSVGLDGI